MILDRNGVEIRAGCVLTTEGGAGDPLFELVVTGVSARGITARYRLQTGGHDFVFERSMFPRTLWVVVQTAPRGPMEN